MATPSRASGSPRPHGRRSAGGGDTTDLREAILAATAGLLADRPFGDLAVGDILIAAGVSRGSFYFYFDSKHDVLALASALTWLGERLYYLAATGTPPFDDQDTLVATLLHIWTTALYEDTSTP